MIHTLNTRAVGALMIAFLTAFSLISSSTAVQAMRINVERGDTATITIRGSFESDDEKKFADAIKGIQKAIVLFSSPGGDLDAGLAMGRAIRQAKFTTGVPYGAQCASACALAWLGGTTRFMAKGGRIGFHAAYVEGRRGPQESGVGNALVGAYLNSLGLAEKAVVYMTSPPPNEIQWLTMEDARTLGVEVSMLTPQMAPNFRQDPDRQPDPERRPQRRPSREPDLTEDGDEMQPIRPGSDPDRRRPSPRRDPSGTQEIMQRLRTQDVDRHSSGPN